MAALLMGKALVAKNPKVTWKQDVIKPFPTRFTPHSVLKVKEIKPEVRMFAPSALNMFCNTSSTTLFAPMSTSIARSFSEQRERTEGARRPRVEHIKVDTFDIENLEINELETSPKGNGFIPISYNGAVLRIDTPSLRAPFGARKYASANGREEANLSLGFDESEIQQKMITIVQNIEQQIVETAIQKAATWFPDWADQSEEKIRASFKSALRPPRDPKFSPVWRIKIKTQPRPTDFFYNGDRTAMEEVVPFSKVSCLAEVRGVWVTPESFGTSWTLLSCRIDEVGKPRERRFSPEESNESL